MSRESDLVDLIKTANEIYLVNPTGNVRSAYIQIDDLCELIMKSYLRANVNTWSAISQTVSDLLDRIEDRRTNRNRFFHDHNMSGLTVTDDHCLQAFRDVYSLFSTLFPTALRSHATPVLRAQVGAIHALKDCAQDPAKKQHYNSIISSWRNEEQPLSLRSKGEVKVKFSNLAYEYCVIHYYADNRFDHPEQPV